MKTRIQVNALEMVLEVVLKGHPNRRLALTQIDSLIAEMQVNAEDSLQLQAADPLGEAVEEIRARLG